MTSELGSNWNCLSFARYSGFGKETQGDLERSTITSLWQFEKGRENITDYQPYADKWVPDFCWSEGIGDVGIDRWLCWLKYTSASTIVRLVTTYLLMRIKGARGGKGKSYNSKELQVGRKKRKGSNG